MIEYKNKKICVNMANYFVFNKYSTIYAKNQDPGAISLLILLLLFIF